MDHPFEGFVEAKVPLLKMLLVLKQGWIVLKNLELVDILLVAFAELLSFLDRLLVEEGGFLLQFAGVAFGVALINIIHKKKKKK